MKHPTKKSVLLFSVLLIAVLFAGCAVPVPKDSSGSTSAASKPESKPAESREDSLPESVPEPDSSAEPSPESSEPTSYLDIAGIDLTKPEIVIRYDDFDGMKTFAKQLQNYEIPADTVVEIFGEVGPSMMTHSIMVPNTDHSTRIGVTYEVVDMDESLIPADETRIHIVGVVRMNENYVNVLVVPGDRFEITEE